MNVISIDFSGKLTKYAPYVKKTRVNAHVQLKAKTFGENINGLLRPFNDIIENLDAAFTIPAAWTTIILGDISKEYSLYFTVGIGGDGGCEFDARLDSISVTRKSGNTGTVFEYTFNFTKPIETNDSKLASSFLKHKGDDGKPDDFPVKLTQIDPFNVEDAPESDALQEN